MLRYKCEDRFAETSGYPEWKEDQKELRDLYRDKVKPYLEGHNKIGMDDDQILYHVCYDCNMELWDEIYQIVKRIGERSNVKINWEEIKHVIKFTFMWTKPQGKLNPHTAHNLRALCAFNIPLIGKTEIIMYDRKKGKNLMFPGSDIYEYARHEYIYPCFLNVNRLHGLENYQDEERVILKTHMLITPIEDLIAATEGKDEVKQLKWAPWLESKFKQTLWLDKR
jgi:hypothetical protein